MKHKTIEITVMAALTAVLLVAQMAIAFLPNIELITLLIIVYTLVLKRKTLLIIYAFALLEGIFYGFGIWWIMYLYVWTILYLVVNLLRSNNSAVIWAMVGAFFGLGFGALCAIPYGIAGGIWAGIAWWGRGIPFDIIHGISNFVIILLLYKPLYYIINRLYKSVQS